MAMPQEVLEQLCINLLEYKIAKGWDYGEFYTDLDPNEKIEELTARVRETFANSDIQTVVTSGPLNEDSPEFYIRVKFL